MLNTCSSLQVDFNFELGITEKSVSKTVIQKTPEGSGKGALTILCRSPHVNYNVER